MQRGKLVGPSAIDEELTWSKGDNQVGIQIRTIRPPASDTGMAALGLTRAEVSANVSRRVLLSPPAGTRTRVATSTSSATGTERCGRIAIVPEEGRGRWIAVAVAAVVIVAVIIVIAVVATSGGSSNHTPPTATTVTPATTARTPRTTTVTRPPRTTPTPTTTTSPATTS